MSLLKKAKQYESRPKRVRNSTPDDVELVTAYCNGEISMKQVAHAWGVKGTYQATTKVFYVMRTIISGK